MLTTNIEVRGHRENETQSPRGEGPEFRVRDPGQRACDNSVAYELDRYEEEHFDEIVRLV